MAFRFPLQAVFHFRQSVEHQQELRLRAAHQLVARARRLFAQLDDRINESCARQSHQLAAGTTVAELRFALQCEVVLQQQRHEMAKELLRLQGLRDQQQKIFQQARREREIVESLRDRRLRDYQRKSSRREQRQLDDLILLRDAFRKRG